MQVFLLARTRSLVIAMCSQQEPRRGSVVVSISFLLNHNRPSPRLDAIQCSCHQAALNRFAIFACMVFRMMRHLRCQSLLLFHFHLFYTLNALAYHNVGTCLWHVSIQTAMYQSTHWKHSEGMSLRYDAIFTLWCDFYKPVQNLFSTFSVIWEIIKPYKVGKYLIGFHLQLLYIRYLMTTW